ncbi:tyrosine-type recombinase/integrase [Parafrankia sp. FMc6]|uniref:tyrosine-type recombinase/integrase n=1 Tax=Parafrankia soli TaxID=2599596 RepID=UPI0034D6D0E9
MSAGLQDVAKRAPRTVNNALALTPFYAGTRITETVGLDIDDVALSAHRGSLRIHGKGDQTRQVPIHPPLRAVFTGWLSERADWPGAEGPALFLNQQGSRLSTAGAHTTITTIAAAADLVTVAELLGHTRRRSL